MHARAIRLCSAEKQYWKAAAPGAVGARLLGCPSVKEAQPDPCPPDEVCCLN